MPSQSEVGLAEADLSIAQAEHNINRVEALLPLLAESGYPTSEVEGHLELLTQALLHLQAQRRSIVEALEEETAPIPLRAEPGDTRGIAERFGHRLRFQP